MSAHKEQSSAIIQLDDLHFASPMAVRVFMEHHVFAVWDFMSLLKWLQNAVAPSVVPWMPPRNPAAARLINEIVLAEESDHSGSESPDVPPHESHFATYLRAMEEAGADTGPILHFLQVIQQHDLRTALNWARIPEPAREFMRTTFSVISENKPHSVAAAFAYGREQMLPDHFSVLLDRLPANTEGMDTLRHYFRRHIEIDGDAHGSFSVALVEELCGDDPTRRTEVEATRHQVIEARRKLLHGIRHAIELAGQKPTPKRIVSWRILHQPENPNTVQTRAYSQ